MPTCHLLVPRRQEEGDDEAEGLRSEGERNIAFHDMQWKLEDGRMQRG